MTNKTINGVPRRMLTALLCHVSELENRALVDELRALLAAPDPIVEADGIGEPSAEMEEAGCQAYMKADGKNGAWCLHKSSMGHAYVAMRKLDTGFAALQSTIAQLKAENERLRGGLKLPERVEPNFYMEYSPHDSGWNACLDATAALNGPTK